MQAKEITKSSGIAVKGRTVDPDSHTQSSQYCKCCKKVEVNFQCSQCKSAKYCSRKCQRRDWKHHKTICQAIGTLASDQCKKTIFKSHVSHQNHAKLIKLIGEKCQIKCEIGGVSSTGLWDTGAMVSVICRSWLKKYLPDETIRSISELIDHTLNLTTATKGNIPYSGWVELQFCLQSGEKIMVPFLVVESDIDMPIVGFNVISEVMKCNSSFKLENILCAALNVSEEKIIDVISILTNAENESLAMVRSSKRNVKIPAGSSMRIKCRAKVGMIREQIPVIFEPDEVKEWPEELEFSDNLITLTRGSCQNVNISVVNKSGHEVTLRGGTY